MVSLSLVIGDITAGAPGVGNFWIPEDGLAEPDWDVDYQHVPALNDGDTLLSARRTRANLAFTIYCRAVSSAALATLKASLEAELWQYPVPITLTVDGVAMVFEGWPSRPKWGLVDSGLVRSHLARATCVVPVNPI